VEAKAPGRSLRGGIALDTVAVLIEEAKSLSLETLDLVEPGPGDLVVEVSHSGISTGTEKLFWNGTMPEFPGMGYPLVPGYEAVGTVLEAGSRTGFRAGERVFVPGADCFAAARGLFGASSKRVVAPAGRVTRVDREMGAEATLLALAATARHAIAATDRNFPELIVGHGVLGRWLARITVAAGGPAPTVWEVNAGRRRGATGYEVRHPEDDPRRDYRSIYDASGNGGLLNDLIGRIARGGEIVLCGFYSEPLSFFYPPAFMKEARIRVAAEWKPDDMAATRAMVENGVLSLGGLITHQCPATDARQAYPRAFEEPECLKMILNWKDVK